MRVLFVSSTVTGGSGKSQRQLGKRLVEAGHEVRFVVDDKTARGFQRKVYEKLEEKDFEAWKKAFNDYENEILDEVGSQRFGSKNEE